MLEEEDREGEPDAELEAMETKVKIAVCVRAGQKVAFWMTFA